jgi:hypothetical protein
MSAPYQQAWTHRHSDLSGKSIPADDMVHAISEADQRRRRALCGAEVYIIQEQEWPPRVLRACSTCAERAEAGW